MNDMILGLSFYRGLRLTDLYSLSKVVTPG
jgi:hypothetical protein